MSAPKIKILLFNFLILLALFIGFSSGARAGFKWDTLWVKDYPYSVNKLMPLPGNDYTYGFIYDYDNSTTKGFVKFSDITGDSLETIQIYGLLFNPVFMQDTNLIIGDLGGNCAAIYNISTGQTTKVRTNQDQYKGYIKETNCVLLTTEQSNLDLYSLDSNKVVFSNRSKYTDNHPFFDRRLTKSFISPKGTYICQLEENGPEIVQSEFDSIIYIDYVLNTNDFSYKAILRDTVSTQYSNPNFHYFNAVFNDQETLLALVSYDDNYIDLFDLEKNEFAKRITFNEKIFNYFLSFDSTGKYLLFYHKGLGGYMYLNTDNNNIEYMCDIIIGKNRMPFSNIFYSEASKCRLIETTSEINNIVNNCNIAIATTGINIFSTEQININSIKIYNTSGNNVYTSNITFVTPYDLAINLTPGVYFIILNINGKNEYHKVLVN